MRCVYRAFFGARQRRTYGRRDENSRAYVQGLPRAVLPQNDPTLALIIKKIAPMASQKTEERVELISLKRWIVSGFILVFAVFLFGVFSTIDGSSKLHMLLFLCFALFISGYCAFFIGSNLNFFIKRFGF